MKRDSSRATFEMEGIYKMLVQLYKTLKTWGERFYLYLYPHHDKQRHGGWRGYDNPRKKQLLTDYQLYRFWLFNNHKSARIQ